MLTSMCLLAGCSNGWAGWRDAATRAGTLSASLLAGVELAQLRKIDKASLRQIERVCLGASSCKPQRQLRHARVGAMLLDQLGEPHPAIAVAVPASHLKAG